MIKDLNQSVHELVALLWQVSDVDIRRQLNLSLAENWRSATSLVQADSIRLVHEGVLYIQTPSCRLFSSSFPSLHNPIATARAQKVLYSLLSQIFRLRNEVTGRSVRKKCSENILLFARCTSQIITTESHSPLSSRVPQKAGLAVSF